jgi:hypothetical protein
MCPQLPRLSLEYSHKVGLQTVITGMPLQIRPVTRGGHAGPVTMGRNARGPLSWTRPHCGMTSSPVFVWCRSSEGCPCLFCPCLTSGYQRRLRARGGAFAFAPTGVTTRSRVAHFCEYYYFVSSIEPYRVEDALRDSNWVLAMQEELNNFTRNEVWHLVPRPNQNVVGTMWVFRNKQDEHGVVTRNKARLVAKGYSQVEGLDFGETYAPVARLESIRILLACATYHGFKLYQMDMKSIFHNGPIKEEVYVEQPPSFEDSEYPNHVYKLSKALYRLKQAPRAWYECLRDFLITNGFKVIKADPTLFTKNNCK